jgi:N-acetylmuramoyl-L-alanine amidase
MIFISAGHNPQGIKIDNGAAANGYTEANLAINFRELVELELNKLRVKYITDNDNERLAEYLERIKTGNGSVVLEFHFDAAANTKATGTTSIVGVDADRLDIAFARELVNATSNILGIKNRGVISEAQSHRGRLGLMRENGIVSLLELCFITNKLDLERFFKNKFVLAKEIAQIIARYEALI